MIFLTEWLVWADSPKPSRYSEISTRVKSDLQPFFGWLLTETGLDLLCHNAAPGTRRSGACVLWGGPERRQCGAFRSNHPETGGETKGRGVRLRKPWKWQMRPRRCQTWTSPHTWRSRRTAASTAWSWPGARAGCTPSAWCHSWGRSLETRTCRESRHGTAFGIIQSQKMEVQPEKRGGSQPSYVTVRLSGKWGAEECCII